MNNPFYYEPDALCRQAMKELVDYLSASPSQCFLPAAVSRQFRSDIAQGKMFGVLIVEHANSSLSYLAGYSGQIGGRSDWEGFVPAVFDYLRPDGYFKRAESEIVKISREIQLLPPPLRWEGSGQCGERPAICKERKAGEDDEAYIRRRQFENAELHRWKLRLRAEQEAFEAREQQKADKRDALKTLRRQKSDALQTWLFRHFMMRNAQGETRDLIDIFATGQARPPAGAGECCEPRLLQYAFAHGLRPVSMAMFWWGDSPKEEVRHHLQHYPACNGKCKPVLQWMLRGIDVEPNPLERAVCHELKIIYEDAAICVVDKPAGMLSVPGKSGAESVADVVRRHCPEATGPMVVHRLDMATSGLMVVAKTVAAYKNLQRQFSTHAVKKRYVAILSSEPEKKSGEIALPLRPDPVDRPRQVVDAIYGRPSLTHYEVIDGCRVALFPHTGRTHQLRVHCAHRCGLNNPIKGDELYGRRAERLYLHAERIVFRHPNTEEEVAFVSPPPF